MYIWTFPIGKTWLERDKINRKYHSSSWFLYRLEWVPGQRHREVCAEVPKCWVMENKPSAGTYLRRVFGMHTFLLLLLSMFVWMYVCLDLNPITNLTTTTTTTTTMVQVLSCFLHPTQFGNLGKVRAQYATTHTYCLCRTGLDRWFVLIFVFVELIRILMNDCVTTFCQFDSRELGNVYLVKLVRV